MRLVLAFGVVVAGIWLVPLFLTVESGLKFGPPYQALFTLLALFGGLVVYLLRAPAMAPPKSASRAMAGVALVFLVTIGGVVLLANVAPQFAFEGTGEAAATGPERGRVLFFDVKVGCFLCHSVQGSGGTRGPDLTHVATSAGSRKPGMSAEEYLRESLMSPSSFVVPPFDNIMPPFAQRLTPEQVGDLLAYLQGLE
ncbi:MAG: cytochrome c [Chloroflexi bacterium]|nr:cytochrome c [Chloroflexota bacterium]